MPACRIRTRKLSIKHLKGNVSFLPTDELKPITTTEKSTLTLCEECLSDTKVFYYKESSGPVFPPLPHPSGLGEKGETACAPAREGLWVTSACGPSTP